MTTKYDTQAVKDMISAAFSAGEIKTLAFDLFFPIYQEFTPGMLKSQMMEAIVEHAVTKNEVGRIVDYVQKKNAYQYNRFSADLMKPAPKAQADNKDNAGQPEIGYRDIIDGDKIQGDKVLGDKIAGNKYVIHSYGSAASAGTKGQTTPDSLSDFQKQRLNTIKQHIERENDLLTRYEEQLRYESDPRQIERIEANIKRQKDAIAKYISEAAEYGVTIAKTADNPPATAPSPAGQQTPQEEAAESPEDKALSYNAEEQPWYPAVFPPSDEFDLDQLERFRNEIDIVIMVATEVEQRAALNLLERYPRRKTILEAHIGPETYFLGKFGAFRTAVTRCGMGGEGERGSRLATPDAIRNWQPKAIIMPGIAFGKDPRKQKMADVLVASKIIPYDHQRVGEERIFRAAIPPSNATLQNRFENALGWRFERPDGRLCKLRVGSILSGGKLVDNLEFKTDFFNSFPEAIGGEMEGAGLAESAGRGRMPWILVKAICDWGDGKKHGKHQPLAAAAAVSLVHHVLSKKNSLHGL